MGLVVLPGIVQRAEREHATDQQCAVQSIKWHMLPVVVPAVLHMALGSGFDVKGVCVVSASWCVKPGQAMQVISHAALNCTSCHRCFLSFGDPLLHAVLA